MAKTIRQDEPLPPDINAWFFKETSLDDLLVGAKPLRSLDDLALDDLTPDEAASFVHAIEE